MSQATMNDRFVLTDGSVDPDGSVLHATAPFIVGLVGAVFGMALIAPDLLRHAHVIAISLLVPGMIASVGIYAWSVFNPGDVVGVIALSGARTLEIVRSNPFASRRSTIGFAEVARIAVIAAYDKDGYATHATVLTLRTGEQVQLGFGLEEGQVEALRQLIGVR